MKIMNKVIFIFIMVNYFNVFTAPLIQKISNNTNFAFIVLNHSDISSCSLHGKNIIIYPQDTFEVKILLEIGNPSLTLRPIYYQESKNGPLYWLTDEKYVYQDHLVAIAHGAFKKKYKKIKSMDASKWLRNWVGLYMFIIPYENEILGYLVHLSRVVVHNQKHSRSQWLSFSKGIFSKLVLELKILQNEKGLFGNIKVLHGEGGVCIEGNVERL